MTGDRKRKTMIAVAVLAVLIGAVIAIVTASGSSAGPQSYRPSAGQRDRTHQLGALAVAADYLGVSRSQLRDELRSGTTLAQIANATSGRSASGLVDALFAARAAELSADVAAGRLTAARQHSRLAKLPERLDAAVYRPHGSGTGLADLAAASSYLGISRGQIRSEQRSGRSLAQIAAAAGGRSAAGLIDALVSSGERSLAAAVSAGTLSHAQEGAMLSTLRRRVTAQVDRVPSARRASGGKAGGAGGRKGKKGSSTTAGAAKGNSAAGGEEGGEGAGAAGEGESSERAAEG